MRATDDPTNEERLAHRAVELAEALLREARAQQTPEEHAQAGKLARMMADPHGKELTIALADQAFRSHRPERIADQLAYLLERHGVPRFMDWWERAALLLGGAMAHYLPSLVVPPIVNRLRHETQNVILPAEEDDLRRYLEERRRAGMRLNLNQLGEAILGEAEAARRLQAYLALLARDDVEYISVKVSSVFSQIDLVAFRPTVAQVAERLRTLYRAAARHRYRHPDGRVTPKFINLDMEEYRDLDLTVTAFREVLDEPEFLPLSAGIVLQAYLPDSHRVQRSLTAWAIARRSRGGAPIKLRIVKGANLAMERIEAAGHGWPQAPYETKVEVDANYKRMLEYGCRPEHAEAVHLGVASHNLFDIAYGLVLREAHDVLPWIEFEMLEGMANHQARAVQRARRRSVALRARGQGRGLPQRHRVSRPPAGREHGARELPAPRVRPRAGLARWVTERDRFLAAFGIEADALRRAPPHAGPIGGSDAPRRPHGRLGARFENEPDTDWTLAPEPRVDRGRRGPLARALAGRHPAPGRRGLPRRRRGGGRPRSLAARAASPTAMRWRGPADVDRALDRRPGRAARVGRAAGHGPRARLEACAAELEPAPRRPHRRDDPRRRQDGDRGGRRGLRGRRLRALLRAHAARDGRARSPTAAWRPLGVVVVTPPWNFPLSIPAGGVLAALAAGQRRRPQAGARGGAGRLVARPLPVGGRRPAGASSSSCPAPTTRSARRS